ncbi:MAG TPA: metallophosphoesterase [Pseudonocardiaceae bacterium]|nr:metallophosphoesterase [Pseudonocardiaceae bacterium]
MIFAQISDLHIDATEHSVERATRVLNHLNDLPGELDAILVTGDIADHGLVEEYEQAAKILTSRHPVLHCPGNHDIRANYRVGLMGEPASDTPINQVFRLPGATFAMCDSSIPGEDPGFLTDDTLTWLDDVLRDTDTPAFVCLHHPPVAMHQPYLDTMLLTGEHRLADVIQRHPNVVAVLTGHAHTAAASTFAGLPLLVAPGVVSTLVMPWEHGDIVDRRQPPGIAYHVLDDNLRFTTHYRVVT